MFLLLHWVMNNDDDDDDDDDDLNILTYYSDFQLQMQYIKHQSSLQYLALCEGNPPMARGFSSPWDIYVESAAMPLCHLAVKSGVYLPYIWSFIYDKIGKTVVWKCGHKMHFWELWMECMKIQTQPRTYHMVCEWRRMVTTLQSQWSSMF